MAGVRRVLEEDLKLDKKTLDPYKKFISEQLDEVSKNLFRRHPVSSGSSTCNLPLVSFTLLFIRY